MQLPIGEPHSTPYSQRQAVPQGTTEMKMHYFILTMKGSKNVYFLFPGA